MEELKTCPYSRPQISSAINRMALATTNNNPDYLWPIDYYVALWALKHINRAEPEKEVVFRDGICPKCGGPTHGVNNGPMKCEDCGYEQPQTYLIEFTEDEITEFRHYLNAVKNRQSLDNDIRMSVFKLLHKFPNTLHTRKKENGENP